MGKEVGAGDKRPVGVTGSVGCWRKGGCPGGLVLIAPQPGGYPVSGLSMQSVQSPRLPWPATPWATWEI